ncbi:ogr/Delta-like zinc finger family protein [Methylomonas sp. LL1]|uniref:ogr/Delta-like zinc finger family protein n=1 Tax=Methylomonas sp. LL1 TaxID=2785785 RepID=UPI0018C3A53E|nr:ogr/Delta-like zinc finger family protein [Methylomonas sp. LL1]QPK65166.1 ogr/Delta-like zinc finger family protein [Methylomonas sp. LL1]
MTVYCPNCHQKARITSRNNMNDEKTVADLYCSCTNKDCYATFVTTLGFKHYLNPPLQSTMQLAVNLLSTLSKAERLALLKGAID